MARPAATAATETKTVRVVFVSLLLDLLSFTLILPLFPRLLEFYQRTSTQDAFLHYFIDGVERYKQLTGTTRHWDTVLLGGFIGSLFSFLQFVVSPVLGRASDKYGRRRVLLWTMLGNLVSTALWVFANSFSLFLLARIVGGLSEGNVQLSIAIISDITAPERRSRHMALVGIAFAIAFTVGPPLGAYLASIDLSQQAWAPATMYPYSTAAIVALLLLVIETVYLIMHLPETLATTAAAAAGEDTSNKRVTRSKTRKDKKEDKKEALTPTAVTNLSTLNVMQCLFTFLFSGMEFTLVFLTFDVLDYTHMQQGKLLAVMGIASALIQGGYVRRKKQMEKSLAVQGMMLGTLGLVALALVDVGRGGIGASIALYSGVLCLAFTSGTVVNSLTSLASLQGNSDRGKHLGQFRSFGQLGRALGPLSACTLYWLLGPIWTYALGAFCMSLLAMESVAHLPSSRQKAE
ncbi:major facilitator superfamily domain-containing protein [Gongronella butleri]|nr:major facilitator superfamily domain-containing protein [Gongronella butleri]